MKKVEIYTHESKNSDSYTDNEFFRYERFKGYLEATLQLRLECENFRSSIMRGYGIVLRHLDATWVNR